MVDLRRIPFDLKSMRPPLGATERMLLLSILIGLFSGLLIVCFHIAIDAIAWGSLGLPVGARRVNTVIAPTLGAIAAVALVTFVFRRAKGSGINHARAAVHVLDGYVPASSVSGKFAACSISIGTGASLGPEDPALQMGAGVASVLGRWFELPRNQIRLIAPVGASAAIAAAFNTPITAVLFVIEQVIESWDAEILGSILLAAVSAVVVSRWYLGDQPLFRVPEFTLAHVSELLVYGGIGIAGGLLATFYVRLMLFLKRRLRTRDPIRKLLTAGAAGAAVGLMGLWLPQVMGPGYPAIDNALHGEFLWMTLLVLAVAKMATTAVCFGADIPGGLFAPTLFVGAMIGGGIGTLAQQYWPAPTTAVSAYVLVGMGTFFAGVFRAPMTSIFMAFEVSASYVVILPVMVANTLAYLVSRRFAQEHLFDALARDEGIDLPSTEEQRERRTARVEDAMVRGSMLVLTPGHKVAEALQGLQTHGVDAALVRLGPRAFASVDRDELNGAGEDRRDALLRDTCRLAAVPHLYPDLALDSALATFGGRRLLPVVRRDAPDQLVGALSVDDVLRYFGLEAGKR
ncbi:MAG TPA: chloride channel protein [Vicinamibacterales bacterium]